MIRVFFTCLFLFAVFGSARSQLFKEVSDKVGLTYNYDGNDKQEIGAGITIIDVNNDGWDDIFQAGGIFSSKLWINKGGEFIDASVDYNLGFLDTFFVQGVAAADFDNDGFEDLFIGNAGNLIFMGDKNPPVLLKNVQGKCFQPVFQETFSMVGNFPGATWGDINNDGFVDLYLFNYILSMSNKLDTTTNQLLTYIPTCNDNYFFLNQGGQGFLDMTKEYGLNDKGCGLAAVFSDYDLDNDVDLLLVNDFGKWNNIGNQLFRNDFPLQEFQKVSNDIGFYNEIYGMRIGPGDFNNDGRLDYYITNIGRNYFYVNGVDGFKECGRELGIDLTFAKDSILGTSWSGLFFDVQNDGFIDLFVSKGYLNSIEKVVIKDENQLFINLNGKGFENISKESGLNDSIVNRGAAFFDFDHDGDVDIVSGVIKMTRGDFAYLDQKIKLFENTQSTKNNFIGFKLVGDNSVNSSCLGCKVLLSYGDQNQIREVDSGSGHSSQSSKILFFGLGKMRKVKSAVVLWGDEKIATLSNLKSNRVYSINYNGEIELMYKKRLKISDRCN